VDYRDLNKASAKDDFHLPHVDVLVDNAAKNEIYSSMDGLSGYNQIKMVKKIKKKKKDHLCHVLEHSAVK